MNASRRVGLPYRKITIFDETGSRWIQSTTIVSIQYHPWDCRSPSNPSRPPTIGSGIYISLLAENDEIGINRIMAIAKSEAKALFDG